MLIIDALKALYKRLPPRTPPQPALRAWCRKWPTTGPRRAAQVRPPPKRRALSNRVRPWPTPRAKRLPRRNITRCWPRCAQRASSPQAERRCGHVCGLCLYTGTYQGEDIPEADWRRISARADAFVDRLTYGRLHHGWEVTEAVKMACCAVAEALHAQQAAQAQGAKAAAAGIKSENSDGYSVSYGAHTDMQAAMEAQMLEAAGVYLPPHSPIRYAGLYRTDLCGGAALDCKRRHYAADSPV